MNIYGTPKKKAKSSKTKSSKKYIGPGEGRSVPPRSKPKPKAQRNESFDMNPLGGTKSKVVAKPKPRKTKVQEGLRMAGAPKLATITKKQQVAKLNTWLAKERKRMNQEMLSKSRARAARIAAAAKKK